MVAVTPLDKVFVGNLPLDTDKKALVEHFEKCGEVCVHMDISDDH